MLAQISPNAGNVLTYGRLLQGVWDRKGAGDVRPMCAIVSKLRRRLGDDADRPTYVFTELRVGYWMSAGEGEEPRAVPLTEGLAFYIWVRMPCLLANFHAGPLFPPRHITDKDTAGPLQVAPAKGVESLFANPSLPRECMVNVSGTCKADPVVL